MTFNATSHNNHSKLAWHNDFNDTLNHATFSVFTQHKNLDFATFGSSRILLKWRDFSSHNFIMKLTSTYKWSIGFGKKQSVVIRSGLDRSQHWVWKAPSPLECTWEQLRVKGEMYGCPLHSCVASNPCSIHLFWVHKRACNYDQGEASHIHADTSGWSLSLPLSLSKIMCNMEKVLV